MKEFFSLDWITNKIAMIVNLILTLSTCICISLFIPNIKSLEFDFGYKILFYIGLVMAIILSYLIILMVIYFFIWLLMKLFNNKS